MIIISHPPKITYKINLKGPIIACDPFYDDKYLLIKDCDIDSVIVEKRLSEDSKSSIWKVSLVKSEKIRLYGVEKESITIHSDSGLIYVGSPIYYKNRDELPEGFEEMFPEDTWSDYFACKTVREKERIYIRNGKYLIFYSDLGNTDRVFSGRRIGDKVSEIEIVAFDESKYFKRKEKENE